ncbi:MAG: hypothetical protein RLZ98_2313 [Pseudomonadota bacterium]|jgi:hypothetical protein
MISIGQRQIPGAGEIYLDHVGWMVADIAAAAATFERLGFRLTPYSVHGDRDPETGAMKPMGSANRLIMLGDGYLEILTPVAGVNTPVAQHMRGCIARNPGVHLVAFTVADAEEDAKRVAAAGFDLQPTVHLRRTIEGQDGHETEVSFTVMRARFDAVPEARIQVLTHHTPDEVWQPRYVGNALGVWGLGSAWLATDDPAKSAEGFARFAGRPAHRQEDGSFQIALERGVLKFLRHDEAAERLGGGSLPAPPQIAAIGLKCRSLEAAASHLEANGIRPLESSAERIIIASEDAVGVRLILTQG